MSGDYCPNCSMPYAECMCAELERATEANKCDCGSGEHKYPLNDGHGIFLCYVCSRCETKKMSQFRSDIMEQYDTDEQIEPEDEFF